jgi:hypothetical protein
MVRVGECGFREPLCKTVKQANVVGGKTAQSEHNSRKKGRRAKARRRGGPGVTKESGWIMDWEG